MMAAEVESTDIVLVGAGPVGVEMAVELTRIGVSYVHLEAGHMGWTISWYAPETTFFSSPERIAIAGVPLEPEGQRKASREEYLRYLRCVVRQYSLTIRTHRLVRGISRRDDGSFLVDVVASDRGVGGPSGAPLENRDCTRAPPTLSINCKRVILAIGDMHRPRMVGVPGEDLSHVSHYLKEPHEYFGQRVLIVGGRNSAAEAAVRLHRIGASVTLCYRGEELPRDHIKYWILPELEGLIRSKVINLHLGARVVSITRELVSIEQGTGGLLVEPFESVLLLTGYEQDSSLYRIAGVALEGEGARPCFDPETMETNVAGLYVIGTGTAGTQMGGYKEFIETSHVHVERVLLALGHRASLSGLTRRAVSDRES